MKFFTAVLACVAIWGAFAESRHPCVYFRAGELPSLREIVRADGDGRLVLRRTLSPWSLALVREL